MTAWDFLDRNAGGLALLLIFFGVWVLVPCVEAWRGRRCDCEKEDSQSRAAGSRD